MGSKMARKDDWKACFLDGQKLCTEVPKIMLRNYYPNR